MLQWMAVSHALPMLSHYPSHPPPVKLRMYESGEHVCSYFRDRSARTRAFYAPKMPGALYQQFMDAAFRRSGRYVYQPVCGGCRLCVPIRVPVETFAASKSQRRAWRKNQDVVIEIGEPTPTHEKLALYQKYRLHWHETDEQSWDEFVSFLYDSPVETVEFEYRLSSGELVGVGICDLCAKSLSAVYFYFDPEHAKRGLGTFSALYEIETARKLNIPYYYLGFWVKNCATMHYKCDFRPCELLDTDGTWRAMREQGDQ
jgi:arginine-tRNA-protein transferase